MIIKLTNSRQRGFQGTNREEHTHQLGDECNPSTNMYRNACQADCKGEKNSNIVKIRFVKNAYKWVENSKKKEKKKKLQNMNKTLYCHG